MKVYYSRVSLWRVTWEACSGNLEKKITGTIPAFALGPRKTKKTCVEMAGRKTFRLLTSSQPSGTKVKSSPASGEDNRHLRHEIPF
jgi:hypothetical protein